MWDLNPQHLNIEDQTTTSSVHSIQEELILKVFLNKSFYYLLIKAITLSTFI